MSNLPERVNGHLPKYTSVGCYPIVYLAHGHEALCAACADDETSPMVCDVNWECPDLHCDACSDRIESAYAEPEET